MLGIVYLPTEPSGTDLIGVFLQQAEVAVNTARDIAEKEQAQNNELKADKDLPGMGHAVCGDLQFQFSLCNFVCESEMGLLLMYNVI